MTITCKSIAAILLVFALAGCGQSGPLYLPGNPSEVHIPAGQQTQQNQQTQPAQTDEDDDDEENDDGG